MIGRLASFVVLVGVTIVQQAPPRDIANPIPTGTAIVTGTVFTGSTGSVPARKARVTLNSVDRRDLGQTAATDDEGRFEFHDVPAGRYSIEVRKSGYLRAAYGAARPNRAGTPVSVADRGRVDGLMIRLVSGAAMSGTVRDARGRPLPGVSVNALRYSYLLGERRLSGQGIVTITDDLGQYRMWALPPGEYVIQAAAPPPGGLGLWPTNDFALMSAADIDRALQGLPVQTASPALPVPTESYAPVFFPGTPELARATTLALAAGDDREGLDIVVSRIRTARIDGVVTRQDGQPDVQARVTLTRAGEAANLLAGLGVWRPREVAVDKQGRFTFYDVSPGNYSLLALSMPRQLPNATAPPPATWAMSEITVDGSDLSPSLTLQPAMTIAGRIVFDGTSQPPDNPAVLGLKLLPPGSGGNIMSGPPGGNINADRTFTFYGVTPGDYRLIMVMTTQAAWSWWPRSAMANGQDVLDTPLRIGPSDKTEMVLTYTDRPTEISGQFQDATGRPAPDYFIVVFPADSGRRTPGSRRVASTRPDNSGRYAIRGLPPGEYLLAALTDLDNEDLNTPSFFDQLAGAAVRVTLAEGRTTTQDLRVGR